MLPAHYAHFTTVWVWILHPREIIMSKGLGILTVLHLSCSLLLFFPTTVGKTKYSSFLGLLRSKKPPAVDRRELGLV